MPSVEFAQVDAFINPAADIFVTAVGHVVWKGSRALEGFKIFPAIFVEFSIAPNDFNGMGGRIGGGQKNSR